MKNSLKLVATLLISTSLIGLLNACGGGSQTTEKTDDKSASSAKTEKAEKTEATKPANESKSEGLNVEKAVLGKKGKASDKIEPVKTETFKQGDTIALLLLNVGKFKKGEDGKHKFDMDMEVLDDKDKVLGSKKGLLGSQGNVNLTKDVAESPYGSIDTSKFKLKPGEYKIKLTIYDKVGGGSATEVKSFKVE